MEAKDTVIDIAEDKYDGLGADTLVEIQAEESFKAGIREVVELVRDWDTLLGSDFDAKYGVYKDSFGFQMSLEEVIKLHFKLGKPN